MLSTAINSQIREFYATPGPITESGAYREEMSELPREVGKLARTVNGLVIHRFVAQQFYDLSIPDEREQETHIRKVTDMLDALLDIDPRPLRDARPPEKRLTGICRNFGVLTVALLRAHGIPARSRYGFAGYFNPPYYEDHHVCEYWNAQEKRWMLVDAQLLSDEWQENLGFTFDPLDVPRDQFLVAGDAWAQSRKGKLDPSKVGTFNGDLYGLWFIAGVLVRDAAALNKMEMLQWDVWGAQPQPGQELSAGELDYFNRLATMTLNPGNAFEELRRHYQNDDRLHVPQTVFNAITNKPEAINI